MVTHAEVGWEQVVFSLGLKLPGKTIFTLILFFIVQHRFSPVGIFYMCKLSSAVIKPLNHHKLLHYHRIICVM